ncbi:MAG: hypothetical protein KME27_11040 [Lyngbya sp. HA4199-MV5]|jgi:hypothetical protein|nr:hypothetical protein [Lyngbya sp. HA4199-MV5]
MPQAINLLNRRFGSLLCVEKTEERNTGSIVWVCQCDCGVTEKVPGYLLTSKSRNRQKTNCKVCAKNKIAINLSGKTFSSFEVLNKSEKRVSGLIAWNCRCTCGVLEVVKTADLLSGSRKRCRQCARLLKIKVSTKHQMCYTKTYRSWSEMLSRCTCETNASYPRYGGRGISICDRWLGREGFINFFADMGERPEGMTLDRHPDNNGDYEPENCRWATPKEQALNRRSSVLITFQNKTQTVSQWSEELGIHSETIRFRHKKGWGVDDIFKKTKKRQRHSA